MTPRTFYDNQNRRVELGAQLGVGGEGVVFEVVGQPAAVAKVYHKLPDSHTGQKLRAMVALAAPELLQVAAWPTATLHQAPAGPPVGLLMPRVSGYKEIHTLYSPAHRKKEFPTADWAFLIQTAMNCAIAFDAVHRGGHAIGDVNQSNVLVSAKATVRLIDCDSYQVTAGKQSFPCEVGVPLYTPPELQGQGFRGVIRTPNHDRFGLAVLIFHLLFVGRHPFSGRPLTRGDLPIEKAIKEFRFAFSPAAARLQVAPPPHAPTLAILSPQVAGLFERAFGSQSTAKGARPTAEEWVTHLSELQRQLKACPDDPGHKYAAHLGQCCWCALMQTGAPNYFISVTVYRLGANVPSITFVLGPAWAEIDRLPRPGDSYRRPAVPAGVRIAPTALPGTIPRQLPPFVVVPREFLLKVVAGITVGGAGLAPFFCLAAVAGKSRQAPEAASVFTGLAVFTLVAAFVFGVWWLVLELIHRKSVRAANAERFAALSSLRKERDARLRARREAGRALAGAENELRRVAVAYQQSFDALKRGLVSLKAEYLALKPQYDKDLRELERNKEAVQLEQFLQTQFISDHDIPGIGPTREAVLRSHNIETAHDVQAERVLAIAGFGPVLTKNLLAWRQQVARNFHFNASAAMSASDLAPLVMKYRQFQQRIETSMQRELGKLKACSETGANHVARLYAPLPALVARLAQAEADLGVLPPDIRVR